MIRFLAYCIVVAIPNVVLAQTIEQDTDGFFLLKSPRMTLVTDKGLDDELKSWPGLLEQAIEQCNEIFQPIPPKRNNLHATVYLVGDRKRWEALGRLRDVPWLDEGFQLGDQLYIVEQPSVFYRRMLFLHEATHWIMYRWQGGAGSPWLMEGMADYLSTHRLDKGKLRLGYFPLDVREVPSWGRIKQVQDAMRQNVAPKLSEILQFPDMRQRRMDRYCWSWAAVSFFDNHPEFRDEFQAVYRGELDYSLSASQVLRDGLDKDWNRISLQWRCFLDDLDFGFSMAQIPRWLHEEPTVLKPGSSLTLRVKATDGWTIVPALLEKGSDVSIRASGTAVIRQQPSTTAPASPDTIRAASTWESTPRGVSAEYHRGHRLGSLVGAWAQSGVEQPSALWNRWTVGVESVHRSSERSLLLLRVNEAGSGLADNAGGYDVEVRCR
jgi:hypothetical protein